MDDADRMIRDYLRRLQVTCRSLPRTSRDELIAEVTAHIEEARAAGEAADEVGVRNLLARLGEPDDVAAAAGAGPAGVRYRRVGGMEIAAVILLLIGGIVVPFAGWIVGAVLLWASPRWRWGDKLIGTLVWPGGLLAPITLIGLASLTAVHGTSCVGSPVPATAAGASHISATPSCTATGSAGPPGWAIAVLAALVVLAPFCVAAWLIHRARRAQPAPA